MNSENSSEHLHDPECSTNNSSSNESDSDMVSSHLIVCIGCKWSFLMLVHYQSNFICFYRTLYILGRATLAIVRGILSRLIARLIYIKYFPCTPFCAEKCQCTFWACLFASLSVIVSVYHNFMQEQDDDMVEIVFDELDLEDTNVTEVEKPNRALQLYLMFLLTWEKLFRISTVGMNILFRFIALFLTTLAKLLGLTSLLTFASTLPKSVAAAEHLVRRNIFILSEM